MVRVVAPVASTSDLNMSMLSEPFKLCSGCSIGARPGRDDNELVLTFELESVQVYDVDGRTCVSSWQLASDECVLCPAIYHPPSQSYWAVRGKKLNDSTEHEELISWGYGQDMGSGTTTKLLSTPFALLSAKTVKCPLVIYKNGGVSVGGDNPRLPARIRKAQKMSKLLKTNVFQSGDVEYVCVVGGGGDTAGECSVMLWSLDGDVARFIASSNLPSDDSVVSDCCVCGQVLVTLSAKGTLCQWYLLDVPFSQSLSPLKKISMPTPPISSHLAAISDDYFALVGVVNEGVHIKLWDIPYFTNQAFSLLTSDLWSVCSVGHKVVVCGSEAVTVAMVTTGCAGGTLAAALGRGQKLSDPMSSTLQDEADDNEWRVRQSEKHEDLVNILTDVKKTCTLEQFMSHFDIVTEVDYSPVVQRLLGETEFWGREALIKLVENGLFPSSFVGECLETALQKRDWGITSVLLQHCCDCVPEAVVVKLLEAVIKSPDVLDSGLTRQQLMNILLSLPVNDSLLHLPLSQLPFSSVVLLLEWLCGHVGIEDLLCPTHPQLTYDSVLEWISILVDVHFTQLALQPQARHILLDLHNSIFKQVKCLNYLSIVGAARDVTKVTPTSNNNWLYKIEKLPITI